MGLPPDPRGAPEARGPSLCNDDPVGAPPAGPLPGSYSVRAHPQGVPSSTRPSAILASDFITGEGMAEDPVRPLLHRASDQTGSRGWSDRPIRTRRGSPRRPGTSPSTTDLSMAGSWLETATPITPVRSTRAWVGRDRGSIRPREPQWSYADGASASPSCACSTVADGSLRA
jgi:hypothetical protein